jgi:iron complex outermembrane receptor protein
MFADIIYRDFNIHVVHASRTKHLPTAPFGTVFNDSRTRTRDARSYLDIQYHHRFGSWETLGRASYDWYDHHGIYVYDYAGRGIPPYTENHDDADGTWWDFQGDASRVFFKRHRVTLGAEFRKDIQQEQANYDIQPYYRYLDDRRSAWDSALYFQEEYSIRNNLAFVAGLRSDWHEKFENTLSPRVGLVFTPKPNTDVKATYSWAFRAPNSYESFYSANKSNTANPALKPERIRSWELDVEHRFGKTYYVSGAGFLNRIDDLIRLRLDRLAGRPIYTNSAPRQTKGIEFELGAKWPGGLEGAISHSLQDSRNVVTGHNLTNSPKQLAKVNLSVPLLQKKLFASVEAQYTSRRRTIAGIDLGGFFIMNTTLYSRKLWKDLDLSASLYNVFDKRYADSADLEHVKTSIAQDERNFRVKLVFRPHLTAK